jgi:hypothetical protein
LAVVFAKIHGAQKIEHKQSGKSPKQPNSPPLNSFFAASIEMNELIQLCIKSESSPIQKGRAMIVLIRVFRAIDSHDRNIDPANNIFCVMKRVAFLQTLQGTGDFFLCPDRETRSVNFSSAKVLKIRSLSDLQHLISYQS